MNLNRRTFIGAAATWMVAAPLAANATTSPAPASTLSLGTDVIWVEDALPAGAILASDGGDAWNWIAVNPAPYSGVLAHRSALASGEHQHYFYNAAATLSVAVGDSLFAYVYLDPVNPPSEVMLQWFDGSWEHRAYWGANLIPWGTDGTVSRRYMGVLPATGQWVRLAVPAAQVDLEGSTLNGMAYTLYGGRATWDYAGKNGSPPPPGGDDQTFVTSLDGGNNVAQGQWSAAGGYGSATGPGAGGAFAFGQGATALGGGAVAFGRGSLAAYTDTFVVGQGSEAYADNGRAAGWVCLSTGGQGYAHGYQADDRGIDGLEAYAHGNFGTGSEDRGRGTAQTCRAVFRAQTNDATPTPLTTDGGPFGFNNQMRLPDDASYVLQWLVIARDTANGNSRAWRVVAMATRGAGAGSTTVFPPVITDISTSLGATGWRLSLTADTYNGAVQLNGIGAAGRPIQWVAAMIDGENIG
jgi:hypothetical protein